MRYLILGAVSGSVPSVSTLQDAATAVLAADRPAEAVRLLDAADALRGDIPSSVPGRREAERIRAAGTAAGEPTAALALNPSRPLTVQEALTRLDDLAGRPLTGCPGPTNRTRADHTRADRTRANHTGANHTVANHTGSPNPPSWP